MKATSILKHIALGAGFWLMATQAIQAQQAATQWKIDKFRSGKKMAKITLLNVGKDTLELNAAGLEGKKTSYVARDIRLQHDTLILNLDVQNMERETFKSENGETVTYAYDMFLIIAPGEKVKLEAPLEGRNTDGKFRYLIIMLENGETVEMKVE